MEYSSLAADEEPQVVESSPGVVGVCRSRILVQQCRLYEHELSEVEVVSHASLLIVCSRMWHGVSFGDGVPVAVYQCGIRVRRHAQESLRRVLSQYERSALCAQQHILGIRAPFDVGYGLSGSRIVCHNHIAVGRQFLVVYEVSVYYQTDVAYSLVLPEGLERTAHFLQIKAWQETVYFSSHCIAVLFLFQSNDLQI